MQNILVTGGAGFIGSHLVELLVSQGYDVTVLDNFSDAPRSNLDNVQDVYTLITGDVRDPKIIENLLHIDTIYHLAANANVPYSVKKPIDDASRNVLGTINMLNLARLSGARFLLASSAAVYGEPVHVPMSENHPIHPISHYGVSKLAAEYYVNLYCELYGLDAIIVRLFNAFGPRQRRFVVFDFARKINEPGDIVEVLGSGRQVRSQLFVEDAAGALSLVARKGKERFINVGSTTTLDVLDLMSKELDLFQADKEIRITESSWDGDIVRLVPDTTRLRTLGFQEKYSFEEGLLLFKDWFTEEYLQPSIITADP